MCIHQGNQASADGESSLQEQIRSPGSHTAVTELLPIMALRGAGGVCVCVCVFTSTQTCPSASCHLFCMAGVHACMLMRHRYDRKLIESGKVKPVCPQRCRRRSAGVPLSYDLMEKPRVGAERVSTWSHPAPPAGLLAREPR